MIPQTHSSAIISPKAKIGSNVEIGAFCVVGDDVKIGDGTILKSHVIIEGDTEIGKNNVIFPFTTIGLQPQDLKFCGEKSKVIIGDNNKIREHATIHLGTQDGAMVTKIGSNCLLMVGIHIAHDCIIGDHVIMANNATLGGHVTIGDYAVIGGLSAIHQFVRIGQGAMIGGMSGVESDVIPYGTVIGERAFLAGLNLIGMKRRNISREEIHALRNFFKKLFEEKNSNFSDHANQLAKTFSTKLVQEVADFIQSNSSRSFCRLKSTTN
ncbi:MAG: acyl-[acyl-carrier-protein]--UDP-N-acetylglucosamine O-acyltransferase [Alphaproteobacteria bacterium RIFCSPLOWO2_01_FULL_40_26]|nr:MAG: acyl-[acyl-carrier-protein]--UDP-N-acetylglucosamine O-acyltransferase [Alphaproteobacteria bacterium RIFCSPHIGHO2_02_FULL_40_34]OFW85490.1 MAG: acyl-[acyl-carrier-protein]--UDP-N-acetylglucosamine O-acyltransferase [Alphaproteobacteria bacterium RIFCSPHIGHO2_01_FULL_40_8]OFW94536.1 MAG: acyl-[acyl-carrier-protein]--UDP-N-acetylglucosamine O-acyltransferase [Alphaproteobacteria bacterium RIFCSPLOWO2_01_FULL_40_26]OFX10285.1 MAG: acyl-[acyl-carrier-protein]--UDP-N-acetylglucosamine O-acyl